MESRHDRDEHDAIEHDSPFAAVDRLMHANRAVHVATATRLRVVESVCRLSRARSSAKTLSERDLASRALRAEVATALCVSERAAENLIGTADILYSALTATARAFDAGDFSMRHVQILVDYAAGLSPDLAAELEAKVLPKAAELSPPRFEQFVRRAKEALHPDTLDERAEAAFGKRTVAEEPASDGMAYLTLYSKAIHVQAIMDRVSKAALQLKRTSDDSRTISQLRADLVTQVLLQSSDSILDLPVPPLDDSEAVISWFRGIVPTVMVTVPALALLGKAGGVAELEGYGPIPLADARILAAKAPSFTRLLTDPISGGVLIVDRKSRKVPKHLRNWLRVRDGSCRFPGCGRLTKYCDIDHTRQWAADHGPTNHDNLAHLCRRHHTLKGETGWSVRQSADGSGVLIWTTPAGHTRVTYPATVLPH